MYFQKLESLSNELEYKEFNRIIVALDKWLFLMPKSYKMTLTPENFSKEEEITLEISENLFEKVVEIGLLREIYYLRCGICGKIILESNDLNCIFENIKEYNEDQIECIFCDKYKKLSINNVFIMYELIDKPVIKISQKKTFSLENSEHELSQKNSLINKIVKNPKNFFKNRKVDKGLLQEVCKEELSDDVKYILDIE